MPFFFEDLVDRYRGGRPCACGREHAIGVRDVLVGRGALARSAGMLAAALPEGGTAWVVSDGRTEEAAGRAWKRRAGGARVAATVLPGDPKPVPTIELAHALAAEARAAGARLVVGIGSGVIADLAKHVSHLLGVPNWAVATAGSVDAYSSATAAIRVEGYHRALPTRVSGHIAVDLDVVARSPRELSFAGFGDLLAKILSFLDWNLARLLTGEHYCPVIADASLGSARQALAASRLLDTDPVAAAASLVDAGLTSGFCMQALGGSRSAASAEHTIAHQWEMAGAVGNPRWDLHGILVGAASPLVLAAYRRLCALVPGFVPDAAARLAAYDRELPWEDRLEEGMKPFLSKIREEMALRRFDRAVLADRLARFSACRGEVVALAVPLLDELESAVRELAGLGYPFSLGQIGVPREAALLAIRNVGLLRHRYSGFDLAYELGLSGQVGAAAAEATR